ncbi:MAG: hypothetical protein ACJ780_30305 [Solirubrobacteraceae bacterium]
MPRTISSETIDRAWTDLERFAVEIGPRVAGTPAVHLAAEMLVAAFADRDLEATR